MTNKLLADAIDWLASRENFSGYEWDYVELILAAARAKTMPKNTELAIRLRRFAKREDILAAADLLDGSRGSHDEATST